MSITDDLFGRQEDSPKDTPKLEEKEDVEEVEEVKSDVKKAYTPQELAELLSSDGDIDRSRLSLEGQALMKSFSKGFTQKFEKIAELRKQLERELEDKAKPPKQKTIEDAFSEDPEGTLKAIDDHILAKKQEIKKLKLEGNYEEVDTLRDEVEDWTNAKSTLIGKRLFASEKTLKEERAKQAIRSSLADYDRQEKAAKIYITEVMGMSAAKADALLGDVELVKHFAKLAGVKDSAEKKITKEKPDELGRAGSDQVGKTKAQGATYEELLAEAKKSGDWFKVLKFKGALG